jgi:hypothetical protein
MNASLFCYFLVLLAACVHILQTKAENLTVDFFGEAWLQAVLPWPEWIDTLHSEILSLTRRAEYRAGGWEMQSHIFAVYLLNFPFK